MGKGRKHAWPMERWLDTQIVSGSIPIRIISKPDGTIFDSSTLSVALRRWLRYCYADGDFVRMRVRTKARLVAEDVFQKELFPDKDKVQKGDFGEIIGYYLLQKHPDLGFTLPILRLRHREDRDSAMHGIDILGFRFREDDGADMLCVGESKLRPRNDHSLILTGHESLEKTSETKIQSSISRTAHILQLEGDHVTLDRLARFSDEWQGAKPNRLYAFIGIVDSSVATDEMIRRIQERQNIIPDFVVFLVKLNDLMWWLKEAYRP